MRGSTYYYERETWLGQRNKRSVEREIERDILPSFRLCISYQTYQTTLSLSHTHTHTFFFPLSLSHSFPHFLSLPLFYTHTLFSSSFALSFTHTFSLFPSRAHSLLIFWVSSVCLFLSSFLSDIILSNVFELERRQTWFSFHTEEIIISSTFSDYLFLTNN